jgi:integrase
MELPAPTSDDSTSSDPADGAAGKALSLPAGLSDEDARRIYEYASLDLSESTRRAYQSQLNGFAEWCDGRGAQSLPADPETVAAYLTDRGPERSASWVTQALAAIRKAHRIAGADDPTGAEGVKRTVKGVKRKHGSPPEPKAAARTKHIRRMVEAIQRPEPGPDAGAERAAAYLRALRDRAMILLGYAAALRRAELAAVRLGHIDFNPEGLELHIPRSKTDQEGSGAVVGVNHGTNPTLCPVTALQTWIDAAEIGAGPVFRAVPRSAEIASDEHASPIAGRTVRNAIARAAEAAELDPESFAGHSLRRGHLTEGAINGAELHRLQTQARHKDPRTTAGYIEDANRMENNTSRELGL